MSRVSQDALRFLQQSDRFEARPILPLHVLIGAPVSVLAALLLSVVVLASRDETAEAPAAQVKTSRAYSAVDVGADRDADDAAALQQAMRLQKAAGSVREQAASVRAAGSTEEAQKALDTAREILRTADGESTMAATAAIESVPEQVGKSAQDREAAASAIEAAAASLEASATGVKSGGTRDTGNGGEFDAGGVSLTYAPLPVLAHTSEVVTTELATQSAARRAMVARAHEALKR
jgi:hypothetical protein